MTDVFTLDDDQLLSLLLRCNRDEYELIWVGCSLHWH